MPSRLPKHLHDALTAAEHALAFAGAIAPTAYAANLLVRSAVERQLEILGEACRRAIEVDPALRERVPEVALAIGLRNRIIHGYDRLEHGVILDTVQRDLPTLCKSLRLELAAYPPPA